MTTQQLFYESVIPVSKARHAHSSVDVADYGFSRKVNSVPLMAVEFPLAAPEYPVVFTGTGDAMMPAVILGVRTNENLYLSMDGKWQAKYIPAFIRRYPFVFSTSEDGKTFTLCLDEDFPGFNKEGRGRRLFTDDGKQAPFVDDVLKFLQDYRAQFLHTQSFCKKLNDLNLLVPMQAQVTLASGEKMSLNGFNVVDRKKLVALPGEKLSELAKTDELELLYLHLQSMRNFNGVTDRLVVIQGGKQDADLKAEPPREESEPKAKAVAGKGKRG
jgi:SapC